MELASEVIAWFLDPANWQGIDGIPNRVWEHLQMTAFSTVAAALASIPFGVWLAHKRVGGVVVVAIVNIGRAIPSFAIVAISLPISIRLGLGLGFWPTFLALLFLAVPPMFSNAYAGIAGVDPALVEAARGMGLKERQVMTGIEFPVALPVVLAGVRIATVQVIATATLGALVAWGGLGRYIIDGFSTQNMAEVFAGGLLVALLAVAAELMFSILERRTAPTGIQYDEPIGIPK
ncbi:MAG: ABC transporter permease subunit [Proteobacteria bacterium]|nr:ABC transporter permease subunit [Pseudomonadota bacterium]